MRRADRRLAAIVAIGVGLVLAPAVFQMFSRAPAGGEMIDDFRPHMTAATIADFRGYMDVIGAAAAEAPPATPAIEAWQDRWPAIDADMRDMLTTMEDNLGRYDGVAALPPFALFPWFFVIPGALAAVLAGLALRASRRARPAPGLRRALVALGVGLIAAPLVFQMFTRAPGGAAMIDDFRPLMSTDRVTTVQQYFLVIGAAEGDLRREVLAGDDPGTGAADLEATQTFVDRWPRISNRFAPMIGAMSDNVDSFAGIDALPPFWLFPWFFVVPGVLVAALALSSRPTVRSRTPADPVDDHQLEGAPA